ncbi:unnamed protein product [Allacma fusca]|uniref:Uncharacterized protein n=1 Tax=Allacma fusca TaxID=39272 RepID=A0A8J2LH29_9HEXA|nr:unnamed protein product [Allacma fusca]
MEHQLLESRIYQKPQLQPYQFRRKVCNPCACCCFGSCSLRMNAGIIAVVAFTLALINGLLFELTIPDDCSEAKRADICEGELYINAKDGIFVCRKFLISFSCIYSILTALTAVVMGVTIFWRMAQWAIAAAILWAISTASFIVMESLWILYLQNWPDLARTKLDYNFGETRQTYPAIAVTRILVLGTLQMYFAICCIQLGKQIKAGEDLDPVLFFLDPLPPSMEFPNPLSVPNDNPNRV